MEKNYFEDGVKSSEPQSEEMKSADLVAQKIHSFMEEIGAEHYSVVARLPNKKGGGALITLGKIDDLLMLEMMKFQNEIMAERMGVDINELRKTANEIMASALQKPKAEA